MKKHSLTANPLLKTILFTLLCVVGIRAQTDATVVAVVNGREIRQSEIDELLVGQIMPLEQQLYAIRKAALENLVATVLLDAEAAKRGISLPELRKRLTVGDVTVNNADVENEYAANLQAFAAMSPDEAKERLRLDLEARARLEKYKQAVEVLRQKASIKTYLKEPRWPHSVTDNDSPALGAADAAVTIIEFADFQCIYCREVQRVLKKLLKEYGLKLRLVFKHLPLDIHSEAAEAARAAFCGQQQGHFWEFHDQLFDSSSLRREALRGIAISLKLDRAKFEDCLLSEAAREVVTRNKSQAARLGITSTPTFLINGRMIQGAIEFDKFKALIEQELRLVGTRSSSDVSQK